jgi:hypothetical protein
MTSIFSHFSLRVAERNNALEKRGRAWTAQLHANAGELSDIDGQNQTALKLADLYRRTAKVNNSFPNEPKPPPCVQRSPFLKWIRRARRKIPKKLDHRRAYLPNTWQIDGVFMRIGGRA